MKYATSGVRQARGAGWGLRKIGMPYTSDQVAAMEAAGVMWDGNCYFDYREAARELAASYIGMRLNSTLLTSIIDVAIGIGTHVPSFLKDFPCDGTHCRDGRLVRYFEGPKDKAWMEAQDRKYLTVLKDSRDPAYRRLFEQEMASLDLSLAHHQNLQREFRNALLTNAEKFYQDISIGLVDKVVETMRKRPEPDWLATALNDVFDLSIAKDASGKRPSIEKTGVTPLYKAVDIGNFLLVSHLLSHAKTNPNRVCLPAKESVLHLAAKKGLRDIARALLGHASTDVNLKDHHGDTPLHVAVSTNNKSLVELLLSHDSTDKNIKDGSGKTALYLAVEKGRTDIVKLLLAQDGCDPNLTCLKTEKDQEAVLHLAVRKGNTEILKQLLDHRDIDVNQINNKTGEQGKTALYLSVEAKNKEFVELLLQKGADKKIACNKEIIKNDLPSEKRPLDLANELVDADKSQEALAELLKEEVIPSDTKKDVLRVVKLGATNGILPRLVPMMMKDYNLAKGVDLVKSPLSAIKDKTLDPLKREYKKASCKDFISQIDSKLVELYEMVKNKLKKYDERRPDLNLSGKFQEILDEMSVSGTLTLTA